MGFSTANDNDSTICFPGLLSYTPTWSRRWGMLCRDDQQLNHSAARSRWPESQPQWGIQRGLSAAPFVLAVCLSSALCLTLWTLSNSWHMTSPDFFLRIVSSNMVYLFINHFCCFNRISKSLCFICKMPIWILPYFLSLYVCFFLNLDPVHF